VTDQVRLTRRTSLKLAGAGTIAALAARRMEIVAIAQSATPAAEGGVLAGLGIPTLSITVTDSSFEGIGGQLDAGMYLVDVTNTTQQSAQVAFMQLPEGMTSADLMSMMGGGAVGTPASGDASATPVAEEGQGEAPPEWFYTVDIPGGVGLGPGQEGQFVITLQTGNYIVWGEDPTAPQQPVDLSVAGDAATPMADVNDMPQASFTIMEVAMDDGYAFQYDGELVTGTQVIAVTNNSDQPHFVEFDLLPEGTTKEDLDALMQSFMTGTPASGGLSEDDFQPVHFIGTQSAGTTQWHEVSFDPGTYAVTCWIPDISRGGVPHAMEGMYDVLTLTEG